MVKVDEAIQLRRDLQRGNSTHLKLRRAIIGTSVVGAASMVPVSMLQTGIVQHLPAPPLKGFHSDAANSSLIAYRFGAPDGPMSVASFAVNIPLAAFGGADRARTKPPIPLLAAGKAAIDAAVSTWYFNQMRRGKKWCPYCIVGAISSLTLFILSVPEARSAWSHLRSRRA
ncbi:MAG: vitamin K epoxide reductase family protein [Bryobacteraceae bacterium]